MELSKELSAMAKLEEIFSDLDEQAKYRVLSWAFNRFNPNTDAQRSESANPIEQPSDSQIYSLPSSQQSYTDVTDEDIATYFDAADPKTDAEKVLVVSAWRQQFEGDEYIDAQMVNSNLKNLGYGVGNITRAFSILKAAKPALVIQTQKSGSTKQARKKFKVTEAGRRKVIEMRSQNRQ